MQKITISDLKQQVESGGARILLDVRTAAEFEAYHAEGAVNMPLDKLDVAAIAGWVTKSDAPIYILCQSGSRAKSAQARLEDAGINVTYVVEGGTSAWQSAGLPMQHGMRRTISLERQVRIVAGILVVIGVLLGWFVHPCWSGLSLFVGSGLVFAGLTDFCGMAIVLGKMPWNQSSKANHCKN